MSVCDILFISPVYLVIASLYWLHMTTTAPSLVSRSAQGIYQGRPIQLFAGSLNGADLSQEWQPGQLFALWEQVQAGSNETHPNTNSKILNHVNKKDVPVSRMQWSQYAS